MFSVVVNLRFLLTEAKTGTLFTKNTSVDSIAFVFASSVAGFGNLIKSVTTFSGTSHGLAFQGGNTWTACVVCTVITSVTAPSTVKFHRAFPLTTTTSWPTAAPRAKQRCGSQA
jgi:hypothetical protein